MNADHQESLARYLEYYCRLPGSKAFTAHLEDISLQGMILSSKGGRHYVSFDPPLQTWTEARERLVQMDGESLKGLDRSDIIVKTYRSPRKFHAIVFVTVLVTLVAFSTKSNFLPGSLLYDNILHRVPRFANFCLLVFPIIDPLIVVTHTAEAATMIRTRLRRHGVALFTPLWWKWTISCWIEGVGSFQRFDKIVREEQDKQKRHT